MECGSKWLKVVIIVVLNLWVSGVACAQESGGKIDKQDTTIIFRELGRWDTDSAMNTQAQTFNDIWGWEDGNGREYAIMGGKANTYFIDITDPLEPELVAKKPGRGSEGIHRDYATYRHYCYAVTDERPGALRIYDLQYLPDSVPLVYDSQEHAARVHNVFQAGTKLYLLDNDRGRLHSPMTVLSLENPENPELLNHLNPLKFDSTLRLADVHDAYVRNDTVYASGGDDGFFIFDYTNPRNPELVTKLKQYPFKGFNHSSWLTSDGKTMVMADENHGLPLKVYDVSDPNNLSLQSTMGVNTDRDAIPHDPRVKGDLAYVSYYHNGLQVFDISDPKQPKRIHSAETFPQYDQEIFKGFLGCWGVYPFFSSGVIAASDMTNGLHLYRIDTVVTNPSNTFNLTAATRFQNQMQIRLDLYQSQAVSLSLYNIQGQRLKMQKTPVWPEGEQQLTWYQLGSLKPGIYWLQAVAGGERQVKKMLKAR